jgi:hypothetical protein
LANDWKTENLKQHTKSPNRSNSERSVAEIPAKTAVMQEKFTQPEIRKN